MKRVSLVTLMFVFTFTLLFPKEQLKLGVIYDTEDYKAAMNKVLMDELERNFNGSNFEPVIQKEVLAETAGEFGSVMASMESDSQIDAVVTLGVLASELTLQRDGSYRKLVVAPFGINETTKKVGNLSYISEKADIAGDIKLMEELKEINRVSFLIPDYFNTGYLRTQMDAIAQELRENGYDVERILADEDRTEVAAKLDNTDVLYILEANYDEVGDILQMAREKKVPSFARISGGELAENVLMGYDNAPEIQRRVRAGVMSMVRRAEGDDPSEIVTDLGSTEKAINFNMNIAREIGVYPNLVFAQRVNLTNLDERDGRALGFKEGINVALTENPDVMSRKEDIIGDEYSVKSAKADRRPQLDAFAEYQRLDKDSARSLTTPAESSVRGGVSLSYLIFDDNINANVSIRDYERQATEARYEQENLDTIQSYAQSYLTILELNARLEVEKYNYELMKEFLQIAKTKFEVGAAGPEDIYRFESEIADALTNIVEVDGQIKIAEADLNRVLNQPMSSKYKLEEVGTESSAFKDITDVLQANGQGVDGIRQYFIDEGISNAPEVRQIDLAMKAKERELLAAKRERYMPKLSGFGEWSDDLKDDWGEGSDLTSSEDRWNVGARVELPLFKGGDIEYTKQRVRSELKSLEHQKVSTESEVGRTVSGAFAQVVKDYVQTATTKEAADAARKNLELVGDFYAQGTISISDLLDARTASISADQVEIASRYSYLRSVVNLERSSGEYFIMMDDLTKEAKLNKLENYIMTEDRR